MTVARFRHDLARALSRPPGVLARVAANMVTRPLERWRRRFVAAVRPSYGHAPGSALSTYLDAPPVDRLEPLAEPLAGLTELYLEHRFDLLGSGWVQVRHGLRAAGLEGHVYPAAAAVNADAEGNWLRGRLNSQNLEAAQRAWREVRPPYQPIDWQLDFKSGYRWRENLWHRKVRHGMPGVDIKVPWELARLQHASHLAHAFTLARAGVAGFRPPEAYSREFRNQVLDFIATNPPGFGANWANAMEAGIRASNWLVAFDLFRAGGAAFDQCFETILRDSIYDHGRYIVENMEWNDVLVANHYLANVVGLLFIAAYLPRSPEVDAWLAFSVQETLSQVDCQFHAEGANFEASTGYHRLSAEMSVYAAALMLALPPERQDVIARGDSSFRRHTPRLRAEPPAVHPVAKHDGNSLLPTSYLERLERAAEFVIHITKPDGRLPQFGDTDSGRFLKLTPSVDRLTLGEAKERYAHLDQSEGSPSDVFWDEDHLDHRSLVAALNGLFGREDFTRYAGTAELETSLVAGLARGRVVRSVLEQHNAAAALRIGDDQAWRQAEQALSDASSAERRSFAIESGESPEVDELVAYQQFGVYVFSGPKFYLAVRCGSTGQRGNGGHGHNDQLAIELATESADLITDPGSYLYTPLPERRNAYRSISSHFAPQIADGEPTSFQAGLFRSTGDPRTECIYFGEKGFIGRYRVRSMWIWRRVIVGPQAIEIVDWITHASPSAGDAPPLVELHQPPNPRISPGYGLLFRDRRMLAESVVERLRAR